MVVGGFGFGFRCRHLATRPCCVDCGSAGASHTVDVVIFVLSCLVLLWGGRSLVVHRRWRLARELLLNGQVGVFCRGKGGRGKGKGKGEGGRRRRKEEGGRRKEEGGR